jgi:hypothetical protein
VPGEQRGRAVARDAEDVPVRGAGRTSVPSLPKASPSGPARPLANGAAGPTVGGWASASVAPSHIAHARMNECGRIRGRVPHERSPRHDLPATFRVSRGSPRPHRLPPLLGGPVRRVRGGRVDALVLGVRAPASPVVPVTIHGAALRREPGGGRKATRQGRPAPVPLVRAAWTLAAGFRLCGRRRRHVVARIGLVAASSVAGGPRGAGGTAVHTPFEWLGAEFSRRRLARCPRQPSASSSTGYLRAIGGSTSRGSTSPCPACRRRSTASGSSS